MQPIDLNSKSRTTVHLTLQPSKPKNNYGHAPIIFKYKSCSAVTRTGYVFKDRIIITWFAIYATV